MNLAHIQNRENAEGRRGGGAFGGAPAAVLVRAVDGELPAALRGHPRGVLSADRLRGGRLHHLRGGSDRRVAGTHGRPALLGHQRGPPRLHHRLERRLPGLRPPPHHRLLRRRQAQDPRGEAAHRRGAEEAGAHEGQAQGQGHQTAGLDRTVISIIRIFIPRQEGRPILEASCPLVGHKTGSSFMLSGRHWPSVMTGYLQRCAICHILLMKGYGFPGKATGGSNPTPSYRADTSKQKSDLINVLKRSEQLWNDEKNEESLVQLRKAISMLEFIIQNESIESVRGSYEDKLKELRGRLKNREEGKEVAQNVASGGGNGGGGKGGKEENNLKGQISEAIVTEKPNVKWEDVSGLENAKNALKEAVILPIRFKEIFTGSRKPWKGILLYGPPGTGKTFLAKACATEAEGTFFSVSSSDLMSKYVGESEKLIKALFNSAREKKPSIIFIDEIDSMCGNRSDGENEASRRVKTEFLVQMQGVGHDDTGVLVLGATNLPWALDPAIRRRFERRIYISLPEYEARHGMLLRGMKDTPHHLTAEDFDEFAKYTDNYSGSDISILIRDAVYEPVRRLQLAKKFRKLPNGKWTPCREGEDGEPKSWLDFKNQTELDIGQITKDDFVAALKRTKPSVDGNQLKEYEEFTKTFGQDG